MQYYTYVIYSKSLDVIYIGQTSNLDKRLNDHNKGYSKYTSRAADWVLVHFEEFASRGEAMKRERQLKSYRGREFVRTLIQERE